MPSNNNFENVTELLYNKCCTRGVDMMKNFNIPMLLLAILVIIMFFLVGLAIAFRNIWLISLFTILGFGVMGYGLSLKRKRG